MSIKLNNGTYDGGQYNLFLVHKPNLRGIMSQSIYDKSINHYITRTVLKPRLSKYLCDYKVATRKCMGITRRMEQLKSFIERNKKVWNFTNLQSVFFEYKTYKYSYKYTDSRYVENTLDKYWYN